jgi:hypothetical protein
VLHLLEALHPPRAALPSGQPGQGSSAAGSSGSEQEAMEFGADGTYSTDEDINEEEST